MFGSYEIVVCKVTDVMKRKTMVKKEKKEMQSLSRISPGESACVESIKKLIQIFKKGAN